MMARVFVKTDRSMIGECYNKGEKTSGRASRKEKPPTLKSYNLNHLAGLAITGAAIIVYHRYKNFGRLGSALSCLDRRRIELVEPL